MLVTDLVPPCLLSGPLAFPGACWVPFFLKALIEHAVTLGTVSRALSPCAVPEGGGAVAWKTALNEVQ